MVNVAALPSGWVLDATAPAFRVPTRPLQYRQADFDARFDRDTVFFDCVQIDDGRIVLIGPPMFNLQAHLLRMAITVDDGSVPVRYEVRSLDRQVQVWLPSLPLAAAVHIRSALGNATLAVRSGEGRVFRGKRVLFTKSKNNNIQWIADWIRYHRDLAGVNAVLLYDNDSKEYTIDELRGRLGDVTGIDHIEIVSWPYRYGVDSYEGLYWDSDFSLLGIMENARWRFLQSARSVLNLDIDELIVTPGETSVFELTERLKRGYTRFWGRWVVGTTGPEERLTTLGSGTGIRHRDFQYTLRLRRTLSLHRRWKLPRPTVVNRSAPKWAVVPALTPERSQWRIHDIARCRVHSLPLRVTYFAHFREINTGWKYRRAVRDDFDVRIHERRAELMESLKRVQWDS